MKTESKNLVLGAAVLRKMARDGMLDAVEKRKKNKQKPFSHFAQSVPGKGDPEEEILLIRLLWERGGWTVTDLVEHFGKTKWRINNIVKYEVRPKVRTEGCEVPEEFYKLSKRPYH